MIVAYGHTRGSLGGQRTNQLVEVATTYAHPFDNGVQSKRIKDSPSGKALGVGWNVAAPTSKRLATANPSGARRSRRHALDWV